jgi:DHA1 family multidrug resistance protein-like MFS transporter
MLFRNMLKTLSIPWQRTLYIMLFAQVITAVGFSSMFPFLPLYVESLGTETNLSIEILAGLVYSAHAFAMMIASPIWGAVADRYGRKLMVERAMFGGSLILLMMAFVTSAEQLVLLRTIQGLITGTIAAGNALVASAAPREQTGYAMGLMQVGLGAGVALGPLIGGLIADTVGYSATFYVTAGLLFTSGILVFFGIKEDFTPTANHKRAGLKSLFSDWGLIFSAPGIKSTYGMRFLSQLGRMIILPIAPLFIQTLAVNFNRLNTFTGLVIGISSAATTVSAVFLGPLGDRTGHRRIVVLSSCAAALLYFLQSQVSAGWQLLALQALIGVALGGIIPAISALLAHLTQTGEEGAVYGLDNSITAGGRALAPLLGAAVAATFSLRAVFSFTGALFAFTALMGLYLLPSGKTAEDNVR